ncbi:MAG TPA: hypothetical protein VGH09_10835 [Solirubrobacteraceae bacterium]|jgi:hypothetical protein
MKIKRVISRTVVARAAFAGSVLAMAFPTAAVAGPLLSGYGGPGQGSQAILGSTLLNGPSGGGGSSGSQATNLSSASLASRAPAGSDQTRGSRGPRAVGGASVGQGRAGQVGRISSGDALYPALEPSASTGALGLSGQNLLLIALALAGVALLAALTVRLATGTPTPSGTGASAQVMGRNDPTMNE